MVRGLIASTAAVIAAAIWAPAASAQNQGTWTAKPNTTLAISRFYGGVRPSNNNIYIAGGVQWTSATNGAITRNTWRYDPVANTVTQVTSAVIPTNMMWGSSAVVGNILYIFGGASQGPPNPTVLTTTVYMLDMNAASPTWVARAALPAGRIYSTAVAAGTDIYVMGGSDLTNFVTRNDRYNTVTNTWSTAANMPVASGFRYGANLNNIVVLAGGADSLGVIGATDLYDPVANTWSSSGSFMNPPMADGGCTSLPAFNRLFCTGGVDGNQFVPATMEFHLPTRAWRRRADLPAANNSRSNMLFTVNTTPTALNLIGGEGQPAGFTWLDYQLPQYGPNTPFNLYFRTVNGPIVGQGSAVGPNVIFGATVNDPDALDSVALEVEVQPVAGTFTGTPTSVGSQASQGIVEIYHPILAAGQYKVRYRARDQWGDFNQVPTGAWVDLGTMNDIDFTVDVTIVFDDANHGAGDGLFGEDHTCSAGAGSSGWGLLIAASMLALLAAGRKLA